LDIILITNKNRTINFTISFWFIVFVMAVIATILVAFVYSFVHYTTNEIDRNRLNQLRRENDIVRQELTRIEKEVLKLGYLIDSLDVYDRKLRTHASLTPIDEGIRRMGTGGKTEIEELPEDLTKDMTKLSQTLDGLLLRAKLQCKSFNELFAQLDEKQHLRDHTPSIIPVRGWTMSGYNYRMDPFTEIVKMHEGLDIAAPIGTPIIAPADGIVKFAGGRGSFGLCLEINHGYGYVTFFAHCQRIVVNPGTVVKRGNIIAYVGNTGKTTGPHLHYEVRVSQIPVDPINFILTNPSITD